MTGGAALAAVIGTAGQAPGLTGDEVVRVGLRVIGVGLPLGSPLEWTVNRTTVGQIRSALGDAVAAHIDVALHAMWTADGGWITDSERAVLRGLGNVSVDCGAMLAITQRSTSGPWPPCSRRLQGLASSLALPAVLAPAAWTAVQEYGRRLDYALHGYELQEPAEAKQTLFDGSYGLLQYAPGWVGGIATFAVPYLGRAMGADGRWDNGSRGPALGADDAVAAAAAANAARARQVYDRTLDVLGSAGSSDVAGHPVVEAGARRGQRSRAPRQEEAKKEASVLRKLAHLVPK